MKSIHNLENCSSVEYSPILACIWSIQGSEAIWGSENMNLFKRLSFKELKKDNMKFEDGFCFAVSLQYGSTLYISNAITKHLGYPEDMLVGQCIVNFLYQKDHMTFANHLTQGFNACFTQGSNDESHLLQNTFFCRLRVYHGLQFGYDVSQKRTQYKPFKVTLQINDLIFDDVCVEKSSSKLCVKATATPLSSAYLVPEEIPAMTSFSTRHTASCHFSHVDASAIPYIGYLPQDLVGYSIFEFYHVDDLPQLKDTYELVMKRPGQSFLSKPYRFKVFNGCYITLETEWSCYVNPWTKKLEFIVGQHRVMKGPKDINIFNPREIQSAVEEVQGDSSSIQAEIKNMLSQPITKDFIREKVNHMTRKRKMEIAAFVYDFIEDVNQTKRIAADENVKAIPKSDPESVVRGDTSPHQDSSTSSETPSTLQKSHLEDAMRRFFKSQEKLPFSNSSEESKSDEKLSNSDESGGNGSKQQESVPSTSGFHRTFCNKKQESESTSSKGNISYLNGDSGYRSLDKNQTPSVDVSDTSKGATRDKIESVNETDKLLPCMSLTEEILSQHNKLNHKQTKHRKYKGKNCLASHKNSCEVKMKRDVNTHSNLSSNLHKPKKYARIQETTVAPQDVDVRVTSSQERFTPSSMASPFPFATFTMPMTSYPSVSMPSASMSPAFAVPSVYASSSPTPVFIPVMYMGPCLPQFPNVMSPNAASFWPYPPVSPFSASTVYPTPIIPGAGALPVPLIPSNHVAANVCTVQSSGVTTTTTVSKATTTIAQDLASSKDDSSFSFPSSPEESENLSKFEDKNVDLGLEKKMERPIRQDPPWLSGVELTPDVVYRYKMQPQSVEDVLMKDMEALKSMAQPDLVNEQLQMLHEDYREEFKTEQSGTDVNITDSALLGLTTENNEDQNHRNFNRSHSPLEHKFI